MRVSLLAAAPAAVAASSGVMKVVKLLQDTKSELLKERKTQEDEYMKLDCVVKKTKEENAKLREENSAKIGDIDNELALLEGGKTLTDEGEMYAAKIDEKNKEIAKAEEDLAAEKAKYDAYMADLNAGIVALADAEKKIQGQTVLVQQRTLKQLLSQSKLVLPSQQVALLKYQQQQAPEGYKSQVGSIVELIQTLKNEYKKEQVDTTQQHEKDVAAQDALIKELKEALSGLQEQQQAGEGEAAAKARRTQELNDLKSTLEKEIEDADAEDKVMEENKTKQDAEYETFTNDSMAQEDAIDKAIAILHSDDNRDLFQKNEDDKSVEVSFLQQRSAENSKFRSMKELALMRERETAIQVLMSAIADQVTELRDEKTSIQTSVEHCTADAKKLLEDAKTAAEQMDGQDAQIRASTEIIAQENAKQETLTKEIEELMEEKKKKTQIFLESKSDLEAIKADLDLAVGEVGKAIVELRKYKPDKSTRFNEGSKGDLTKKTSNPLAPVITMLDGIVTQMKNESKDRTTQITDLTTEQNEMVATIGNASEKEESGMVTTIETPESIIGGKEKERNASVTKESEEEGKKTTAETDYGSEREKLYGKDGTTGLLASFNKLQPGCDYWMLGSQARYAAIDEEIRTLDEVKHVLSNQDLVFDESDTMQMEAREKGADSKDHAYEAVGSRST
ncbi:unnamed protein product [Amoebophrya sp. A25]|nr:unnamed protein product [Amoebophrya sp. A25]|eukprot:GSA25T00005565001.1